jgi:4-hydroxythreonine-4-phosphate dehydrogenase
VGDEGCIRRQAQILGVALEFPLQTASRTGPRLSLCPTNREPLPPSLPTGGSQAAEAALAWLTQTARLCLEGKLDGMVTAPLSKAAILRTGRAFTGQTEYLTELAGHPDTAMMLLGEDDRERWLRVTLVTTHVPLRAVASAVTPERILKAVRLSRIACQDLGLPRAKIALCGLNPHAGEAGQLGDEEVRLISPTVHQLRQEGHDLHGPFAADTLFHTALQGDYDVVVAMYHDQGLAPLKLAAFDTGVNWTLGLPFVRTSPDHGPAYDIAGQGKARASSMQSALRLARRLARRRQAT